jgi:hypothetical protein
MPRIFIPVFALLGGSQHGFAKECVAGSHPQLYSLRFTVKPRDSFLGVARLDPESTAMKMYRYYFLTILAGWMTP